MLDNIANFLFYCLWSDPALFIVQFLLALACQSLIALMDPVTLSAYIMTLPLTFRAARPVVCISEVRP